MEQLVDTFPFFNKQIQLFVKGKKKQKMEIEKKKVERKESLYTIKENEFKGPKLSDFEFTEGILKKIYEKKKKKFFLKIKIKRNKKYGKLQEKSTRMLKNMFY